MIVHKAHVYRLYPTPEQAATLACWVGAVRFTYNLALEQRRDWYRPGRRLTWASQCREVTALRAEVDWLRAVPVHALSSAVRDLDQAYQNWWAGRAHPPTPRKRGLNDSMRFSDPATFAFRRLSKRLGEVKLPKLGWVQVRWDKAVPGIVKNITVSRRAGMWTVAAQWEAEVVAPAPSTLPAVGIDRGVTVFAALSNGMLVAPVNAGRKAQRVLAKAQRKLARKKRGSMNRRKQALRVARVQARVARTRKDFCHKASTIIAKNHGAVVLERVDVCNMTRTASGTLDKPGRSVRAKAGLNRSILDPGWGMFRVMLAYKLAERGAKLIEVSPYNTSRTCAACGVVDQASRKGIRFCCTDCGHLGHADINAAINILQRAQDMRLLPVEASHQRAVEAGTIWIAA